MAIGNVELMHESSPKHLRMGMGIARMKYDKETDKENKLIRVNICKKSTAGTGKKSQYGRYSPKQWMNYLTNLAYTV